MEDMSVSGYQHGFCYDGSGHHASENDARFRYLPKLEKCDTPTLTVVNGFIDYLLVVKDEYITRFAIEASATHDAKSWYEHKIVFVDKKQKH